MDKEIAKFIEEICIKYGLQVLDELDALLLKELDECFTEIATECQELWDEMITKFYSYGTTRYVRHGTSSPGEGGNNLFKALHVNLEDHILHIKTDTSTMDTSGRSYKNGYTYGYATDGETVLDRVEHGYRFYPRRMGYSIGSAGEYSGRTINGIMTKFKNKKEEELSDKLRSVLIEFLAKYA